MKKNRWRSGFIWIGLAVLFIGGAYAATGQADRSEPVPRNALRVPNTETFILSIPLEAQLDRPATDPAGLPVQLNEDFETTWPGPGWTLMDVSDRDDGEYLFGKRACYPHSGTYAGWSVGGGAQGSQLPCSSEYPNNTDTWAIFGPLDLQNTNNAKLVFYLWGKSESDLLCFRDYLAASVSVDGSAFSEGKRYCGDWTNGSEPGGYTREVLDLSYLAGRPQVWIGFRFHSGLAPADIGFTVDDITITTADLTRSPTPTWSGPSITPVNLPAVQKAYATPTPKPAWSTPTPTETSTQMPPTSNIPSATWPPTATPVAIFNLPLAVKGPRYTSTPTAYSPYPPP